MDFSQINGFTSRLIKIYFHRHSIQYKEIKVTINKQEVERQLGLEVEKEEEVLDEEEYDASGFSQFAIGEII